MLAFEYSLCCAFTHSFPLSLINLNKLFLGFGWKCGSIQESVVHKLFDLVKIISWESGVVLLFPPSFLATIANLTSVVDVHLIALRDGLLTNAQQPSWAKLK